MLSILDCSACLQVLQRRRSHAFMTRKDCDLGGASANTATVNSADADVCSAEDTRPARGKEAGGAQLAASGAPACLLLPVSPVLSIFRSC